jgi:LysM repeat protein
MKVFKPILITFLLIAAFESLQALPDSLGLKKEDGKTFIMHRVERGETLFGIGQRYGVSLQKLKATNPQAEKELVVGEVLLVPYQEGSSKQEWQRHTVKKGETLFSISQKYKSSVKQIKQWNNLESNSIAVGQELKVGKKEGEETQQQGDSKKEPEKPEEKTQQAQKAKNKDKGEYADDYKEKASKTTTTPKGNGLVTKEQEGKATWLQNSNINTQKSLALHRSAPAGTIIKVKNQMNDKVVYVRTVGKLNKSRDKNTLITISKKAAKELGVEGDYFRAKLQFTVKKPSN